MLGTDGEHPAGAPKTQILTFVRENRKCSVVKQHSTKYLLNLSSIFCPRSGADPEMVQRSRDPPWLADEENFKFQIA